MRLVIKIGTQVISDQTGLLPLRIKLLFGQWAYEKSGVMDDSHVRFFKLESARRLLEENGLRIARMESFPKRVPSRVWPSLLAITFLFECIKQSAELKRVFGTLKLKKPTQQVMDELDEGYEETV